jgi:hypothetical protein
MVVDMPGIEAWWGNTSRYAVRITTTQHTAILFLELHSLLHETHPNMQDLFPALCRSSSIP